MLGPPLETFRQVRQGGTARTRKAILGRLQTAATWADLEKASRGIERVARALRRSEIAVVEVGSTVVFVVLVFSVVLHEISRILNYFGW